MEIPPCLDVRHDSLRNHLVGVIEAAKKIWAVPLLQHYTKHDLDHSLKIIKNILPGLLEAGSFELADAERFILLCATFLHDIGMQSPVHAGLRKKDRYSFAEFEKIRELHHEASARMIRESGSGAIIPLGLAGVSNYIPYIAEVARYHRALPLKELKDIHDAGNKLRLPLLAALLRLADALDADYERVDMDRLKLVEIPPDSKCHWWCHHYVQSVHVSKGRIKLYFRFPDGQIGEPLNDVVKEKIRMSIQTQVNEVYEILENYGLRLYQYVEVGGESYHQAVLPLPEDLWQQLLKSWEESQRERHELSARLSASFEKELSNSSGFISHRHFPKALVDQKIEQELSILQKARFVVAEFDRIQFSTMFATRLMKGDLSGGSDNIRCRALAWCARVLSYSEKSEGAEEFLHFTKTLGRCPEIDIASAFLDSAKGEKKAALNALAGIGSQMSRTAALQVVAHHDGSQAAVDWLKNAGLTLADLDPDGKLVLLMLQHELGHWEAAQECVEALNDDDFDTAPLLNHMAAMTHLVSTVPNELRPFVLSQVPFEAAAFPLSSDTTAIEARRIARRHFTRSAKVARELNCPVTATIEDEYALWLELRDPEDSADGRKKLESRLRDTKSALRLVHLGRQFGIKLDLEAVNREIERQIALNGGMTADTAIARLALAFRPEKTPQDVANYIARYRDQLFEKLDKQFIVSLEIEMLSRAGLPDRAKEGLSVLIAEGISESLASHLQRIISEAEGTDPIEARKEQFKETNQLTDLFILVDEFEARGKWVDLCEYGAMLFERTRSLRDAERLAKVCIPLKSSSDSAANRPVIPEYRVQ